MKKLGILILVYVLFGATKAISATNGVAKVLKFKGKITYQVPGSDKKGLFAVDMWLPEKSIIISGSRSYAKLIFLDKSRLTIGPKSRVEIKKFSKGSAGVINLIRGKLRSQVTKNYLDIKNTKGSKLYITTKNAAMGVRGTDFQVNYHAPSNTTDLITYSGAVAFNRLDTPTFDHTKLEALLTNRNAVIVKKSKFVRVTERDSSDLIVHPLNAIQTRKLKKNDTLQDYPKADQKKRDVIPPGVNSKQMGQGYSSQKSSSVPDPTKVSVPDSKDFNPLKNKRRRKPKRKPPVHRPPPPPTGINLPPPPPPPSDLLPPPPPPADGSTGSNE